LILSSLLLALAVAALHAQQPVTVQNVAVDRCANPANVRTWGLNYPSDVGRVQLVPAEGVKRFYLCTAHIQLSDPHPGLTLELGTGTTCLTGPATIERLIATAVGQEFNISSGGLSGTFAIGAPGAALCADRGATAVWIYGYIRYVLE
jgi:hypothetical protein